MDPKDIAAKKADLTRERDAAQLLLNEAQERLQAFDQGGPATDADPGDESDGHPGLDNPAGQLEEAPRRLSRDRQRQADRLAKIRAQE